ncbi:MAG: nickel pincer cofactor biosynthesis protein LarB [Desulfuromonadia bacterium]
MKGIEEILRRVASGELDPRQGMTRIKGELFGHRDGALIDHHRHERQGGGEVVFGEGKSTERLLEIAEEIVERSGRILVTRIPPEGGRGLRNRFPDGLLDPEARCFVLDRVDPEPTGRGTILVVSAGTSDIPVAREAEITARFLGNRTATLFDAGVAGIHRLFAHRHLLEDASVIIAAAGMEGALPSVIGGLVPVPVIALPTSVGYGASFGGVAALLAMLNSCASGVTVVNIDNGFGAGFAAHRMNRP